MTSLHVTLGLHFLPRWILRTLISETGTLLISERRQPRNFKLNVAGLGAEAESG